MIPVVSLNLTLLCFVSKDEVIVKGLEFKWEKLKKKLSLRFDKINRTGWYLNIWSALLLFPPIYRIDQNVISSTNFNTLLSKQVKRIIKQTVRKAP